MYLYSIILPSFDHDVVLFSGPSYAMDSGSSGSLMAFEHAYRMLKTGTVDGVVVVGCSLLLNPVFSVMMQKMDLISPEGLSKPFDASGTRHF